MSSSLIDKISQSFDTDCKVVSNEFSLMGESFSVFYIESMIDKALFSSGILAPIEKLIKSENETQSSTKNSKTKNSQNQKQTQSNSNQSSSNEKSDLKDKIKSEVVSITSVEELTEINQIIDKILSGYAVVAFEKEALCYPIFGAEKRGIEEPPNSRVIKGPREGFVEDLSTNVGLIRKRVKSKDLRVVDMFVGKQTNTQVTLFYMDKIAKPEIVEEVKRKIKKINIDAIIDSYYIESFLETDKIKFFRRVGNTEKPDVFCAKILEGRIGIIVDGSPIALTVPFVLFEDLQSAEDYYTIPARATFVRIMRIIGLIFAILVPGVYVALQSFNYRILPLNFLITILSSIEGLSIPPLVEILVVLFLFEVITEASLQMPNQLGMALSIIGALALGNTAVDAGIISPPSIVIVAISSTSLYIIPDQISETRLLRILFTVIGGLLGLYGIVISFIILTTYLCSMTSFGVPYMSPIAPSVKSDKKDAFIKRSVQDMKTRPKLFADDNKVRQGNYDYETKNVGEMASQNEQSKEKNSEKSQIRGRMKHVIKTILYSFFSICNVT